MNRLTRRWLESPVSKLLLAVLVVATLASGSPGKCHAQESNTTVSRGENDGAAASFPEQADFVKRMKVAEKRVDKWFETRLVAPLGAVLFYDFETERWVGTKIPFVVAWLFLGATFFTLRMGFINFRGFKHAIAVTMGRYDDPSKPGEVSHFQALASALSATVGLGNIGGVAVAVGLGGPGAIFWMIMCGLLGMTSKFSECTLGQMYRKVAPDGTISGGPMHYLKDGLAELGLRPLGVFLSVFFAVLCIGASFGGGCAFQVNQSLNAISQEIPFLDEYPIVYGLMMAVMTGLVIIGGIRRIGATAEKIVPAMCLLYILMAIWVLITNASQIPAAFGMIVKQAFLPESVYGGFIGVLVLGIRRGAFSNEAGVGSASIAHSAAKTDEPVSEGVVALLEPFIDTVVVCTITGLVIVITGAYSNPEYQSLVETQSGAALTSKALGEVQPWFPKVLSLIVFLFAFSTLISWSYYGERCTTHLLGPRASMPYKIVFLAFVLLGSVVTAKNVFDFSDLMILSMAVPNILGVALLSGKIRSRLDEYWARYRSGALKPAANS